MRPYAAICARSRHYAATCNHLRASASSDASARRPCSVSDVAPLRFDAALPEQSHEGAHPHIVIRPPPRGNEIPVDHGFARGMHPDTSRRDDVRLDHDVAAQPLSRDPRGMKRFEQQVRVVAALAAALGG